MKNAILLTFIFLSFISCSEKKSGVKKSFKIIVGATALAVPVSGGAFLEAENQTSGGKTIIKLDAENSAIIPLGTYKLLFVAFTGPSEKSGTMYCGSVDSAVLQSTTSSLEVTLSQANCPQSKYTDFIYKLIGNSNWDSATFDQSKWGP